MQRGFLRHSVVLYIPHTVDVGNEVTSWGRLGKVRCSIKVQESFEAIGTDYQGSEIVELTMPYSRGLDVTFSRMLALHRGKLFEVMAPPTNVGYMDKVLKILAKHDEQSNYAPLDDNPNGV